MKFGRFDIYFKKLIVFSSLVLFVSSFLLYISVITGFRNFDFRIKPIVGNIPYLGTDKKEIKAFASNEEFKEYVQKGAELAYPRNSFGGGVALNRAESITKEIMPIPATAPSAGWNVDSVGDTFGLPNKALNNNLGGVPDRVSQTNVQVIGIDEPDIIKTDGKEIYFSPVNQYSKPIIMPEIPAKQGITWDEEKRISNPSIMPPITPSPNIPETKIIKAFPPADLALDGKIDKKGDLLLSGNTLMVFSGQEINAYNVSNPKSPSKKWNVKLENNNYLLTSRLYNGKVYLITRSTFYNENNLCPATPLKVDGLPVSIKCQDIYHPVAPVPVDTTFSAMVLNPASGKIEKMVSFVGSSNASTIYMSENSIYITYVYTGSLIKFFAGFLNENSSIFPAWLREKISALEGYDISEASKMQEFSILMEKYTNSLAADDRLKIENELQNKMSDYYEKHKRELEKTGIVKVGIAGFKVVANGSIPGHLLNNFSLDEYNGNLRAATTIGSRWGVFNGLGRGGSTNDVYVLDKNMNVQGSVKDFGETEQIYSVRFVGNTGFVVTFRQTDPFFVMDLSNPKKPELKGELKIPGFSSYLHPLDETHILGIGKENSQVKISLFDVSDKTNPVELNKYLLDEYWTDVQNNYHAFLLDSKHKVFFLPGGKGGYVFSYKDNGLDLMKAVSLVSARRAIYLDDYMYIVADDKITVLDEKTWEKVNEFEINQ